MLEKKVSLEENSAVLVGIIRPEQSEEEAFEHLDELAFLATTAGVTPQKIFTQKLNGPNSKTFIGPGKLNEVLNHIKINDTDIVIFDDELSPGQLRNIEKILETKVLDRTNLILDIFANRAQTSHAKTQVELAQYRYLLPRLTGMWTHLERQRGGIGMRGPGETQIETDRRIVLDKISRLKVELKKIDKQKTIQRKNRGQMVRVALVGYTNVGKSTLMNVLSKSEVFAENKLFATLDTTVRKVVIENLPFLLSDTVGFIRKLPHDLVESFKSTLDEVREADLLLHIIDVSHKNFRDQMETVERTISEIGGADIPSVYVFNKVDAYKYEAIEEDDLNYDEKVNMSLEDLQKMWFSKQDTQSMFISAKEKTNLDRFKKLMYDKVKSIHMTRFPYNNFLYQNFTEEDSEDLD